MINKKIHFDVLAKFALQGQPLIGINTLTGAPNTPNITISYFDNF